MIELRCAGAALLLGASGASAGDASWSFAQQSRSVGERVGAGLNAVRDWSRDDAFIDVMRQARAFGSPAEPWNAAGAPPLGADGWPADDFGVVLMADRAGTGGLGGRYMVRFECNTLPVVATVASPGSISGVTRDPSTGVVTAALDFPDGGEQMMLAFTRTQGGVRNLTVTRPGAHDHAVFTDAFLAHVDRFAALRFMDWADTNNSAVAAWEDRTQPGGPSYAWGTGVAWEDCIELCNAAGADLWVNVPHMADDEYVAKLAGLIHSCLDPALAVYVEYSNEVWNWQFDQAHWNLAQAIDDEAAGVPLDYDAVGNEYVWAWRRVAERTKQISDIFRREYGDKAMMKRVRPVYAAQVAWPQQYAEGLRYLEAVYGDPGEYVYGIAAAPYFNMGDADDAPGLTGVEVLDALDAGIDRWRAGRELEIIAAQAAFYGLGMLAYEGGPDTFGPNNVDAKRDASYDPRMGELCAEYLDGWNADGGGLFVWYTAGAGSWDTPYGTWPLMEDLTGPMTPKVLALDGALASSAPPVSAGVPLPGPLDARRHTERPSDWETADPHLRYLDEGEVYEYLVRSDSAGTRSLRAWMGAPFSGGQLAVSVNHAPEQVIATANTGWYDQFEPMPPVGVTVREGLNTLRIRVLTDRAYDVESFEIACPADLNADGLVNLDDLDAFIAAYTAGTWDGDMDYDADTDADDLALFVEGYRAPCG